MNNGDLSKDLLEQALPEGFEEELLQQTVRTAVRRKQIRQGATVALALAVFGSVVAGILRPGGEVQMATEVSPVIAEAPIAPRPFNLIATVPLERKLATGLYPAVPRLTSRRDSFVGVHSTPAFLNGLVQISDEELFKMLDGKAFVLIREPGRETEVLFLEDNSSGQGAETP